VKRKDSGQALLELLACLPVFLAATAVSIYLFKTEWNRIRCARQAFRVGHQSLRSDGKFLPVIPTSYSLTTVEKTETGIQARSQCGRHVEVVKLPDLENAKW
jgi:hypothetical protein